MAQPKDHIKTALDEGRMLILGAEVLLGLQFKSALEKGFEKLPELSKYLKLGGLGLMVVATALLMSPGAYHYIVRGGEDHEDVHSFTTRVMDIALLPFAFGLGIDLYVGTGILAGSRAGLVAGLAGLLAALFFWYGLEFMRKARREPFVRESKAMSEDKEKQEEDSKGTKVKDKIQQVLTEGRMVLPGAQALLGFQFIAMMMESFEKLPTPSKYVHLVSLFLIALSIILLMTPPAYHRLVEKGEETEHFHRFASRMLIAAMIPLALGLCGDFYVVAQKVTESPAASIVSAVILLLFFYGLWFGFTLYRRSQQEHGARRASKRKEQQATA